MTRNVLARIGACVAVAAIATSLCTPVYAHNGVGAAFKGPAGRYTVYAYDGYPIPNGQLQYRLILLDRATGEPAEGVAVAVSAHPLDAPTPIEHASADVMNNVAFYNLPNPYPKDWRVTVDLRGSLGLGRTVFSMHGQAPYVPANATVVTVSTGLDGRVVAGIVAGGVAVVAVVAVWFVRRRRAGGLTRRSGSSPTLGGGQTGKDR